MSVFGPSVWRAEIGLMVVMELHLRLEALRSARGVSVSEVARQIGESASTVQTWFNGKHLPKLDAAAKLADYFEVSLDHLAGRDGYAPEMTTDERALLDTVRTMGVKEAKRRLLLVPDVSIEVGDLRPTVSRPGRRRPAEG